MKWLAEGFLGSLGQNQELEHSLLQPQSCALTTKPSSLLGQKFRKAISFSNHAFFSWDHAASMYLKQPPSYVMFWEGVVWWFSLLPSISCDATCETLGVKYLCYVGGWRHCICTWPLLKGIRLLQSAHSPARPWSSLIQRVCLHHRSSKAPTYACLLTFWQWGPSMLVLCDSSQACWKTGRRAWRSLSSVLLGFESCQWVQVSTARFSSSVLGLLLPECRQAQNGSEWAR